MLVWKYEVISNDGNFVILLQEKGFDTEEDAELQGRMDAKAAGLKNYIVRTVTVRVES